MKNNLPRIFFEWALITSVLMSVGFFAWYWMKSREVRIAESQINADNQQFQRTQFSLTALSRDCEEYAKTNPDMARLLTSLTTPSSANPTSARPKGATR